MDSETAEWVAAEQVLGTLTPPVGDEFVVTRVERISATWVVYWNSKRYLETKAMSFSLAGNGPVLVADDYTVDRAGTAHPVEHYVREFEARAR